VQRGGRAYFESAGLRIELPEDAGLQTITVDADNIIVSRVPLDSSARNCFPGEVTRVARGERGGVLTIDCGTPPLARIRASVCLSWIPRSFSSGSVRMARWSRSRSSSSASGRSV